MRWTNNARHRRTWLLPLIAAFLMCAPLRAAQGARQAAPAVQWVKIDGSKNPELIPEWSAWEDVFSTIAGGPKQLPTSVQERVSQSEADLIRRESDASVKRTADCNARAMALAVVAKKEKQRVIIERTKEIRLECRWANLEARDRVMAALNPEARIAMNEFVRLIKTGTSFTLAKSELSFFRQPQ